MEFVQGLFEKWLAELDETFCIDGHERDPLVHSFIMLYLSQVYDIQGEHSKALKLIDAAIEHTPTVIEFYQTRARILKNIGNLEEAIVSSTTAKKMDEGDRFLNYKLSKYQLRNDQMADAHTTMIRWSVDMSTQESNLHDMQNTGYESELGRAYMFQEKWFEAYQMYSYVDKHVFQQLDDCYDFHFYTLRKYQFRAFMNIPVVRKSVYTKKVLNSNMCMLKLFRKIQTILENEELKEHFFKQLDAKMEENQKLIQIEEDKHKGQEEEDVFDPLEKQSDPLQVKSFKSIIDSGIAKSAVKRVENLLKQYPDSLELHYENLYWQLHNTTSKNKNIQALESLSFLLEKAPESTLTQLAVLQLAKFWESADQTKLSEDSKTKIQAFLEAHKFDLKSVVTSMKTLNVVLTFAQNLYGNIDSLAAIVPLIKGSKWGESKSVMTYLSAELKEQFKEKAREEFPEATTFKVKVEEAKEEAKVTEEKSEKETTDGEEKKE